MAPIAQELDLKLRTWPVDKASDVEKMVAEIIQLADQDLLQLTRSRAVEQEVLDLLDETEAGPSLAR